jgi:hypothetical protein
MASIWSMDLDKLKHGNEIAYRCGLGENSYQVIVRKL